jgi:hypothetical protein
MIEHESDGTTNPESAPAVGRNEPCPCGSGKKYKRCCGVGAAPKLGAPRALPPGPGPGGFDPSQMDPAVMAQFSQALQRLPRGQMQRLQSIMQKAMAGKDVSREAEEFEKTLPPDFKAMMGALQGQLPGMPPGMGEAATPPAGEPALPMAASSGAPDGMTAEEARAIVAKAAAEGKISKEEAESMLAATAGAPNAEGPSKVSKFWRSLTGKT